MQTFQQIVLIFAFISLTFARPSTNKSDKRLIKFSEEEPAKWISQADIETMSLSGHRIHFIDITDRNYPFNLRKVTTKGNVNG
jgi:acid phosphatase class B